MDLSPPLPPRAPEEDYSLRRYLLEAFEVATSADSRLLRTFAALLARPGALTAAYFSPERDRYLRPQQVLLFCSVFFFFAQPVVGFRMLSSPLRVHVASVRYADFAKGLVDAEVARRGGGMEAYRIAFDAAADSHARTLAVLLVPLFALLVTALFWKPRRFFVQHLVLATHFVAFILLTLPLLVFLVVPAARAVHALGVPIDTIEFYADWVPLAVLYSAYLYPALRGVYAQGRLLSAAKTATLTFGMMYVVLAYRFILFLTTYYSV